MVVFSFIKNGKKKTEFNLHLKFILEFISTYYGRKRTENLQDYAFCFVSKCFIFLYFYDISYVPNIIYSLVDVCREQPMIWVCDIWVTKRTLIL